MSNQMILPTPLTGGTDFPNSVAIQQPCGRQGDAYMGLIHGKYYAAAFAQNVFHGGVTAVAFPQYAANAASVCSLYNPIASGKILELLAVDIGVVLATTVVNTVGLYYEKFASAPTLTAKAFLNAYIGATTGNAVGVLCSALTHVAMGATDATTARVGVIHTFGATTTTNAGPIHRDFDGQILIPPGVAVSICNSTAASTASSATADLVWAEWDLA